MGATHFDRLAKAFATTAHRRGFGWLLAALPLAGGLPPLLAREPATARRRSAHQRRGGRREQVHDQRNKKKKNKRKCAKAGQPTNKKHKKCCKGLVKDGSGQCAATCAATCAGCCAGESCQTGTTHDACGAGGAACAPCGAPTPLCINQICQPCDVCASGCPFSAVQPAIDAASAGATIRLCAGLYNENIKIAQSLSLIGAGDGTGAGHTILHGLGTTPVVRVTAGNAVVSLQNLRITGGSSFAGGGIRNTGSLTLSSCTITGNTADDGGGIFNINGSTLTLTGCTVSGNSTAGQGGGIYNGGTLTLDAASRVTGNEADPNNADSGGGIYNNAAGAVNLSNALNVTGNTPDDCGGITAGYSGPGAICTTT